MYFVVVFIVVSVVTLSLSTSLSFPGVLTVNVSVLLLSLASPDESSLVSIFLLAYSL